jgi:quaternary ammonium compound-resistance protein SugE
MGGLAYALRGLPIGTAYPIWVGIGAALTAGYAMHSGQEPVSALPVVLLLGIVGSAASSASRSGTRTVSSGSLSG